MQSRMARIKEKYSESMRQGLSGVTASGERVVAAALVTWTKNRALAVAGPIVLLILLVIWLTQSGLGVVGDVIGLAVFLPAQRWVQTSSTPRYLLAATDRRLIWIPWTTPMLGTKPGTPRGNASSDPIGQVILTSIKPRMRSYAVVIRRPDGSEARLGVPNLWENEILAVENLLTSGDEEIGPS